MDARDALKRGIKRAKRAMQKARTPAAGRSLNVATRKNIVVAHNVGQDGNHEI